MLVKLFCRKSTEAANVQEDQTHGTQATLSMVQGNFVGISGFYVVPQFLQMATQAEGSPRMHETLVHAQKYLRLPFQQVSTPN